MGYLLAISIGPVQDFIAAARKTRDLWYGSTMLSDLSRHVALTLRDEHGVELIFPHPSAVDAADDERPGVANKLLAVLPGGDPATIAGAAREAAESWLVSQYEQALKQLGAARRFIDEEIASRQVKHFLEFYSAWAPFDGSDYVQQHQRVDLLLAGRKALRDFIKADGKSGVPKSSLDPARESVLRDDGQPNPELRARLALKEDSPEPLDALSIIKRIGGAGGGQARFPSVIRIAADPYLRWLECQDPDRLRKLTELAIKAGMEPLATGPNTRHYASFPYDSQILYADDPEITDETTKAEIRELIGKGPTPTPYVATLRADGDRMGVKLRAMHDPAEHRSFSETLAEFAGRARAIVREHRGVLVYSGGDDVLAFLPVETALDCAGELRQQFAAALRDTPGPPATLSVGLSISHYRDPLWLQLERADEVERAAKGLRNALAVAWHTRSGGGDARCVVQSWDYDPVSDWQVWIDRFADDSVPDGAVYELRALAAEFRAAAGLRPDENALPERFAFALQPEVKRILQRKRAEGGRRSLPDDLIEAIASQCAGLDDLERAVDQMIVARRFAQARQLPTREAVDA